MFTLLYKSGSAHNDDINDFWITVGPTWFDDDQLKWNLWLIYNLCYFINNIGKAVDVKIEPEKFNKRCTEGLVAPLRFCVFMWHVFWSALVSSCNTDYEDERCLFLLKLAIPNQTLDLSLVYSPSS